MSHPDKRTLQNIDTQDPRYSTTPIRLLNHEECKYTTSGDQKENTRREKEHLVVRV